MYNTYKKYMTPFWEEKLKNGKVRVVKIMSDENVEAFMAAPDPKELLGKSWVIFARLLT